MRRHVSSLIALAITLPFVLLAETARANSVALIWQISGTPTTTVVSSSVFVTADVVLTVFTPNTNRLGWSIAFDGDADEVFASGSCGSTFCGGTPVGGTNWSDFTFLGQGPGASGPSHESSWVFAVVGGAPMSFGTATVGTMTFHVKAPLNDGIDVIPAFLNTASGDGCFDTSGFVCDGSVSFHGATINLVPEPGALALVGLGLAGLGLGARRRPARP